MSRPRRLRLIIRSSAPPNPVYVLQDGDDAFAGADHVFNDAFTGGANAGTDEYDRFWVALGRLGQRYDSGWSFDFRIHANKAWLGGRRAGLLATPGSVVELWGEPPEPDTSVSTRTGHLNAVAQATPNDRVRLFYGEVVAAPVNQDGVSVRCAGPRVMAQRVKLYRGLPEDIKVPHLIFNTKAQRESQDYLFSVKKLTAGPDTFGVGESDLADPRMTVREILEYLESEYLTELVTRGIALPGAIFDPTDLANLPDLRPDSMVFQSATFTDGVMQVLQLLPQFRLTVDARTLLWRLTRVANDLTVVSAATTQESNNAATVLPGGIDSEAWVRVGNGQGAAFDPGGGEIRARLYDGNEPEITEDVVVVFVTPGVGLNADTIYLRDPLSRTFPAASIFSRIDDAAVETIVIDTNEADPGWSLEDDLQGTYSAVRITSVHQKTEVTSTRWTPLTPGAEFSLQPGWDPAWNQSAAPGDEERTFDYGSTGLGMPVYDIVDHDVDQQALVVRYSDSAWGENHVDDEWVGAAVILVSRNGGANALPLRLRQTIVGNEAVADVGDGTPGMKLILPVDVDFLADVAQGSFNTIAGANAGSPEDLIKLSSVVEEGAASWNQRAAVGRKWYLQRVFSRTNDTNATDAGLHNTICRKIQLTAPTNALGANRTIRGVPGHGGLPAVNAQGAIRREGQWDILAESVGIGGFLIARAAFTTDRPLRSIGPSPQGCATMGWRAPKSVNLEIEVVTREIREVRCPNAQDTYAGEAYIQYGWQDTLDLVANQWIDDEQTDDYQRIADGLWSVLSAANRRGSLTIPGQQGDGPTPFERLGVWIDLSIRAQLSTTASPPGSATFIGAFRSAVVGFDWDIQQGSVTFEFDDRGPFAGLAIENLEQLYIPEGSRLSDLENKESALDQAIKCFQAQLPDPPPRETWAENIQVGGRPGLPVVRIPNKDNLVNGIGPVPLDMAPSDGLAVGAGGASRTLGPKGMWTPIRDAKGQTFLINPAGAILPASSPAATTVELAASSPTRVQGTPQINRDTISTLYALMVGGSPASGGDPVYAAVAAGSTTTVLELNYSGFTADEFAGGVVLIQDFDTENPRPPIGITSHTAGGAITLETPFSGASAIPAEGTLVIVAPMPPPTADPADFPGSLGVFKDASGGWTVIGSDGTPAAADLEPDSNTLITPAVPRTPDFVMGGPGDPNASANWTGPWTLAPELCTESDSSAEQFVIDHAPGVGFFVRMTGPENKLSIADTNTPLSFFGSDRGAQRQAVANAVGGTEVATINALIAALRNLGILT